MSRDILARPIQRIGLNRYYRVNFVHDDFGGNKNFVNASQQVSNEYKEEDLYNDDDDYIEENDLPFTIEELANSTFKLNMDVAQAFYGTIIGIRGVNIKRIMSETQTEILIPRNLNAIGDKEGVKSEGITIKGKTRKSIYMARRQINAAINSSRQRMRPTHFVCVPLNSGEIQKNFLKLKQQILDASFPGIDETLFMGYNRMHVTVVSCVLLDDKERQLGVNILQSCRKLLKGFQTPFDIRVSGLEIMNDDPSAVRVLYARVEATELQKFADLVYQQFIQSDMSSIKKDKISIKMHMTVMNVRYRKRLDEDSDEHFDARKILQTFANYEFGTTQANKLDLCVLGSVKEPDDYYKVSGSLVF